MLELVLVDIIKLIYCSVAKKKMHKESFLSILLFLEMETPN